MPMTVPLSSRGKVEVTSMTRLPRKSVSTCFSLRIGSPVRITRKWLEVSLVSSGYTSRIFFPIKPSSIRPFS